MRLTTLFSFPLLFFMLLSFQGDQEYPYPKNYFDSPLPEGVKIYLAGNFGELRSNHFHSGLDMKTNGAEGMHLRAVADGYVSRIVVSSYGYGTTLYLNHPNGYTSVYAHLQGFTPKIAEFIEQIQVEKQSWEVEVYPGKEELSFKKGDWVAISGNSGASRAPHLHFEMRDSRTQIPIDPLLFGFDVFDDISPRVQAFKVYPIGEQTVAKVISSGNYATTSYSSSIPIKVRGTTGKFTLYNVKEIQFYGSIGFGISAYDFHNNCYNLLGIAKYELQLDGKTIWIQDLEKVPFNKSRYLNALIDYEASLKEGRFFNRLYQLPGNMLNIYPLESSDGTISLSDDSLHLVTLKMSDRNHNTTELAFNVRGLSTYELPSTLSQQGESHFKFSEPNSFENEEIKINFDPGSFYTDIDFSYKMGGIASSKLSYVHQVHNSYTPCHKYYLVSIKAHNLKEKYQSQALLLRNGKSEGGFYKDGWVSSRTRYFGSFTIGIDSVAPLFSYVNIFDGKDMARNTIIQVRISDNMSGISSYKAFIDGNFIPMSYDHKTGLVTYRFPEKTKEIMEHEFVFTITDRMGNSREKTIHFKR